jgi:hypothetical protein
VANISEGEKRQAARPFYRTRAATRMQKMLRLAERLAVMAKVDYRREVNKQRMAQHRFLLVAQKMAPMQKRVQTIVQNAVQYSVQKFLQILMQYLVQKFVQNDLQKLMQSSVQICVRKKNGSDADSVTDAELRAECRAVVYAVIRAELFAIKWYEGTKCPIALICCNDLVQIRLGTV